MTDSAHSIARLARHLVTWGAFSLVPALFAANGPPPVVVQGVVETINDVLRRPYARTNSSVLTDGQSIAFVSFDVPTGKRLIVETITMEATHLSTDSFSIGLVTTDPDDPQNGAAMPLSLTTTRPASTPNVQHSVGVHPITLRVDSRAGVTDELRFVFTKTASPGTFVFRAHVRGYIVDIPTN